MCEYCFANADLRGNSRCFCNCFDGLLQICPALFSVALAQLPQKMGIGTLQAMRLADLIRAGLFVCYIFVDSKWSMFAITCAVSLCRTVEMPCFYSLLRANPIVSIAT